MVKLDVKENAMEPIIKKTRNVFCEEDGCKEGYFNLNGVCMTCSEISPGCSKCVKEETSNVENRNFKCTECLNDE